LRQEQEPQQCLQLAAKAAMPLHTFQEQSLQHCPQLAVMSSKQRHWTQEQQRLQLAASL
jgi:hypothetical protein